AYDGNILFLTSRTAQQLLGRGDVYDRFDVRFEEQATYADLERSLPRSAIIRPARRRNPTFDFLYSEFQLALVGVAAIATLIGAFIVYNTVSLSVVERSKEIGTWRALGARRSELLGAFTLEALLIGTIASGVGCVGGRLMAVQALAQVGTTVNVMM